MNVKSVIMMLLLIGGIAQAATRVEVMRFGKEIQDAVLAKGDKETFYYSDGLVISVDLVSEQDNGVIVQLAAAIGYADFARYTQTVEWNGVLTIAEPQSGDIITITFART